MGNHHNSDKKDKLDPWLDKVYSMSKWDKDRLSQQWRKNRDTSEIPSIKELAEALKSGELN